MSADHIYEQAGSYIATLRVTGKDDIESNSTRKMVFVGNTDAPLAVIQVRTNNSTLEEEPYICNGWGAFRVDRTSTITLDGRESINKDGSHNGLTYTWKYLDRNEATTIINKKFDELGCFPVTLTVKNATSGEVSEKTIYLAVENLDPKLTSITATAGENSNDTQKILVQVTADGAEDPDGVITSYVWYYTTEGSSELQDVRITQTPKTTFVLPNITEKYYF